MVVTYTTNTVLWPLLRRPPLNLLHLHNLYSAQFVSRHIPQSITDDPAPLGIIANMSCTGTLLSPPPQCYEAPSP